VPYNWKFSPVVFQVIHPPISCRGVPA
jgi:hypothetical protein